MTEDKLTAFGRLMKAGMDRKRITQRRLGRMLSVDPEGPIYDATTIRMIQQGERRLTHELVATIVDLLELDWAEAWATSGLLPPDVSTEDAAQALETIRARRRRRGDRELSNLATSGASTDQHKGATSGYPKVPATSGTAESVQPAQLAQVAA